MAKVKTIEIKKKDTRKNAAEYGWTSRAAGAIKQIAKEWLDTDSALSVLLFFKDDGEELHAYMPIVPADGRQGAAAHDIQGAEGEPVVIGIEPYPAEESPLSKEDMDIIARDIKQNYYWNGNKVFRMSGQGGIQEDEIDSLVEEGVLARPRVSPVGRPAAKKPAKKPAAKKTAAKKPSATKATAKKPAVKKPAVKKAMAKKPTAKRSVAKKPAARKPAAKKTAAKKPAAKKAASRKPAAKKSSVKKTSAKKSSAGKMSAKKSRW